MILNRDLFEPLQLIQEDEVFPEVVKKLLTSVGHRVFVINDKSEVVGYITAKDVLPFFTTDHQATQEGEGHSLRSELYLYESFFEKSPFMMHSVNKSGVIQMANEVLHAVLEYPYGELIGRTIFDLYEKDNQKKAEDGIKTIFKEGFHEVVRSAMLTKDGQRISVELVSRVLTNQFGEPIGTITVSRPLEMEVLLNKLPKV
jgi:PAS domain S-box-containing protein